MSYTKSDLKRDIEHVECAKLPPQEEFALHILLISLRQLHEYSEEHGKSLHEITGRDLIEDFKQRPRGLFK